MAMRFRGLVPAVLALIIGPVLAVQGALAQTQTAAQARAAANIGTVRIITGDLTSTTVSAASDMAHVLDKEGELRVLPVLGKGSVQNISDLLYLRGIDIGMVQSDVLSYFKRTQRFPGIGSRIHYITKLFNEELHVLASMSFLCLDDLGGRRVNMGRKYSGTAMTAQAVFDAHGVKVKASYYDPETAVEKLKRGELDAMVLVSGKPSRAFDRISYKDRVHFLDVTLVEGLSEDYLPAVVTNKDYPNLIAPDETVTTIAVGTVLAVFNWAPKSPRFVKVNRFVNELFDNIETFQKPPRHPKWREVNLSAAVPGWQRFSAAEAWLRRNRAQRQQSGLVTSSAAASDNRVSFEEFLKSLGPSVNNKLTPAEKEALFKQFSTWQNRGN